MSFLSYTEIRQVQQLLVNSPLLQTADADLRRILLSNCGLKEICDVVPLNVPTNRVFVIKLVHHLLHGSVTVETQRKSRLVVFLDYLSLSDGELSDDDRGFIEQIIAKWEQVAEGKPAHPDVAITPEALEVTTSTEEATLKQISDATHWIGAFSPGDTTGFQLRSGDMHTFGPGELATMAEKTRDLLTETEGKKYYRLAIASPLEIQGRLDRFENDMVKLAVNGYTEYIALFFSRLGADGRIDRMQNLEDVLQNPCIISVARCRGKSTTIPWAALYSHYLDTDKMRTGEIKLCRIFKAQLAANKWSAGVTELVEKHDLLDDPAKCRNNPRCPLQRDEDGPTVCPFGFWGFLHQIEEPLQQVKAISVDQVPEEIGSLRFSQTSFLVRFQNEEVQFVMAAYPAIPNVENHKEEFKALGQGGRMEVVYEEERDKVMSRLRLGGCHLYYFYCLCEMKDHVFKLKLGPLRSPGYIASADLSLSWRRRWPAQPRPLMILNGSESIAPVPERAYDFLDRLRMLGASGVVGSQIKLWSQLAQPFGFQLVKRILEGRSVGESFLDVRRHLLRQCNPLGLAYSYYGSATLHLHDPDGCGWCQAHPPVRRK